MAFWKESMINRLSNLINRNRSAAKESKVMSSRGNAVTLSQLQSQVLLHQKFLGLDQDDGDGDNVMALKW